MAHEVESLMYVRETPWHGLGTKVEEAPTSAEAIKLAGLDWEVQPKPIYTEDNIVIPNHKANVRDIDNKVLGIVTDRYKIVQNQDAFDFTDNLIGEDCKYETAGSLCGGKKIFLLARMPERKILEEAFDPYICFTNTHDGSGSIRAIMTPTRVVCQNTLSLALKNASRMWSTRHVGDLESKLAEARHTLQLANDYMDKFEIVADQLAHTKVTDEEVIKFLDDLFPVDENDSDRKKRNVSDAKEQFMICMLSPDILKYKGTAYQVVQAASDFATHIAPKRMTNTYKENNFNKVLNGHIIIDKTFETMMKKVLKTV